MKTILSHVTETIQEATLIRVIEKNDSLPETVQGYIARMNALAREGKAKVGLLCLGEKVYYCIKDLEPSKNGSYELDEVLEGLNNVGMYDSIFD